MRKWFFSSDTSPIWSSQQVATQNRITQSSQLYSYLQIFLPQTSIASKFKSIDYNVLHLARDCALLAIRAHRIERCGPKLSVIGFQCTFMALAVAIYVTLEVATHTTNCRHRGKKFTSAPRILRCQDATHPDLCLVIIPLVLRVSLSRYKSA